MKGPKNPKGPKGRMIDYLGDKGEPKGYIGLGDKGFVPKGYCGDKAMLGSKGDYSRPKARKAMLC